MSAIDALALGIPVKAVTLYKDFLARVAEEQTPCTQTDPELFWAYKPDKVAAAKALCRTCPLRAFCLMYALDAGERDGVWGGTDEAERNDMLNRRSRAQKAARARQRRAEENAAQEAAQAELAPALF
jgi:WhiB family redox-sensing transcriptional regulator